MGSRYAGMWGGAIRYVRWVVDQSTLVKLARLEMFKNGWLAFLSQIIQIFAANLQQSKTYYKTYSPKSFCINMMCFGHFGWETSPTLCRYINFSATHHCTASSWKFTICIYIWKIPENSDPPSPPSIISKSLHLELWTFWFSVLILLPLWPFGPFPLFLTFFLWLPLYNLSYAI